MAYADDIVTTIIAHYSELVQEKSVLASHCEEVAQLVLPAHRNTFYENGRPVLGSKNTERQLDATAALALHRFMAICDSLLTPRNSEWHRLGTTDASLNRSRRVKLWFEDTTRKLFALRYAPDSGFAANNQQIWRSLGAYGNGALFSDGLLRRDGSKGFRYKAVPFGEIYWIENHQGIIDGFVRAFRMTARQIAQKWKDNVPATVSAKLAAAPETQFVILHCVKPREDMDRNRIDYKGMPYGSYYVCKEARALLSEGGFHTFPLACARFDQEPGEKYGRGPAMTVLPAIKTLQSQKKTVLKAGHRTADPVILTHDDGIVADLKPGAKVPGGVNADGRPLVMPLPMGRIDIGKDMMDDERAVINDAFFVQLFQVLLDDPKVMTATQVIEMAKEKGILLAPTIGKQSDYLGLVIERELDLGSEAGLFEPMPPELIEARGEYSVIYTSPLAKAARAQEAAGFQRSIEFALEIANVMQSPEPLDPFDFSVAIPEIATEINGTPERWMKDPRVIAQIREQRAQQAQMQTAIQAAPGAAALMKAEAVAAKGGQKAVA